MMGSSDSFPNFEFRIYESEKKSWTKKGNKLVKTSDEFVMTSNFHTKNGNFFKKHGVQYPSLLNPEILVMLVSFMTQPLHSLVHPLNKLI